MKTKLPIRLARRIFAPSEERINRDGPANAGRIDASRVVVECKDGRIFALSDGTLRAKASRNISRTSVIRLAPSACSSNCCTPRNDRFEDQS